MDDPIALLIAQGQEPPELSHDPVDRASQPALAHFSTDPGSHPLDMPMKHRATCGTHGPQELERIEGLLAADQINDLRYHSFRRFQMRLFGTEILRRNGAPTAVSLLATQSLLGFFARDAYGDLILPMPASRGSARSGARSPSSCACPTWRRTRPSPLPERRPPAWPAPKEQA